MPLASDASKSIKHTNLYEKRITFLGKLIDGSLITFGVALIFTGLARLFNIYDSPLSTPQLIQGLLGLLLFISGVRRNASFLLAKYHVLNNNISEKLLGLFPFLASILFIIYRIQLEDLNAYRRLVEEGSLVEWFSFIFLLLSAFLFLLTGKKEINKLPGKFVLALSGLSFFLAMEEVSWGQMIFNWQSPQFFTESNAQQETNIHNLIFLSGEPNTLIVALTLASLTIFCLINWRLKLKGNIRPKSIAEVLLPPLSLIGYFAIGSLLYFCLILEMRGINIPILIPSDQELFECFFALGVLLHSCRIYIRWGMD